MTSAHLRIRWDERGEVLKYLNERGEANFGAEWKRARELAARVVEPRTYADFGPVDEMTAAICLALLREFLPGPQLPEAKGRGRKSA